MPPGNFAFLTPSVTPRPQNRPRKTGKLTPVKNPSTTGSAGRSDPARDACGRPRAFHLLFFHTFHHFWFLGKHSPGGKVESWRILRLRWRLFSGLGCFLFFLPNSPLCGPNRPLSRLRRVVPPPGEETGQNRPPGGESGPWAVLWGPAWGQLFFRASAVRSATSIGESRRPPVFRVTCVTGGKGSSVFCEGGTVSLPSMGFALRTTQDMELRMENDYGVAVLVSEATRPSSFLIFWRLRPAYCV